MIHVCGILELDECAVRLDPGRLVSIVAPEEQPPTPLGLGADAHLRISCHDIVEPTPMEILPDRRHVKQLIAFAGQWDPATPILIHCQAGISRSTAAALVTYAVHFPDTIHRAAWHLRHTGPHAHPNPLIASLGDELLGLEGRLIAAVEAMGQPKLVPGGGPIVIPHPQHADR